MSQSFIFHDVLTTDPDGSRQFFADFFGWTTTETPGGPLLTDDSGIWGGFTPLPAGDQRRPQWIPYVAVPDVDAAAERSVALGARIIKPRTDLPPGSVVVITEPGGAAIALWQAAIPQ